MSKKLNINKYDMIELKRTRELFSNYIGNNVPQTYEEWVSLCPDYKAAALYCKFFNTICLSWYKVMNSGIPVEDGISEILQYIQKNVSKIENDEKRFTERYIYIVCKNCLVDLTRRSKFEFHKNESVFIEDEDGKTILDYGTFVNDSYFESNENSDRENKVKEFWSLVSDLSIEAKTVIAKLLDIDYDITDTDSDISDVKKISRYRKMKLTPEKEEEVISILRERLSCMVDTF